MMGFYPVYQHKTPCTMPAPSSEEVLVPLQDPFDRATADRRASRYIGQLVMVLRVQTGAALPAEIRRYGPQEFSGGNASVLPEGVVIAQGGRGRERQRVFRQQVHSLRVEAEEEPGGCLPTLYQSGNMLIEGWLLGGQLIEGYGAQLTP
jgi:hypothetical protein